MMQKKTFSEFLFVVVKKFVHNGQMKIEGSLQFINCQGEN